LSTSPNSRQRPTVLNIKYSTLNIADNKIADADELKTRLIDEWAQFDQLDQ